MSTIPYIRMKIDLRLRQQDTKNRSYSVPEVDQAIREKYITKQASLPPAHVAETAAFTLGVGLDTFTVTLAGTSYSDALDVRLQLQSTGTYLTKATTAELDTFWRGVSPLVLGVPSKFTLWEDHLGVLKGRVYPGALVAQPVNMYRSRSHTVPFSATDLDSAAIYFNEAACSALAAAVAADLLLALPEDELKKRRLNRDIAKVWHAESNAVFYQEESRRNDLQSVGRVQRWVG